MAGSRTIEGIAARAEIRERKAPAWLRALGKDRLIRAYRNVFLDADGNLTPDGVAVIADLSGVTRLGMVPARGATDAELRERTAAQGVVLHMIERMDLSGRKLRELAVELRESER